jgi:hypothetical protein
VTRYFQIGKPDFWEAITPGPLHWTIEAARLMEYDLGTVVLSDNPVDAEAPVTLLLRIPPGEALPRHAHPCHRVEIIVSGSLKADDGTALQPGDVIISSPGEFFGPHIAGPEGCLSVAIYSKLTGMQPIYDSRDTADHADKLRQVDNIIGNRLPGTVGPTNPQPSWTPSTGWITPPQ